MGVPAYAGSGSPYMGGGVPAYAGSGGGGGSPYMGGGVPAYAGSASSYNGYQGGAGSYSGGGAFPPSITRRRSPSPFLQMPGARAPSPYMADAQRAYAAGGYGAPYTAPSYGGGAYDQPSYQPVVPYSSGGTTTIPAPPGSTIIIKGRSRRSGSHSGHHHGDYGLRRVRSADMRGGDRYDY